MYLKMITASLLCVASAFPLAAQNRRVIWFDRPASLAGKAVWQKSTQPESSAPIVNRDPDWERASLPIGNGSIGANIMGSISVERLTLNEKTLWRGGPGTAGGPRHYWDVNKNSTAALAEIRKAFADGNDALAAKLTRENMNGKAEYEATDETPFRFGGYTTLGELTVETGLDDNSYSDYRRELSVDSSLVSVSFNAAGVRYRRTFFASYPDNVMAIRFSASQRARQNLRLVYAPTTIMDGTAAADGTDGIVFCGRLRDNNMEFCVRVRVKTRGGSVDCSDGTITVRNADEVLFLFTADTDYKPNFAPDENDARAYVGVEPVATTQQWIKKAAARGYESLLRRHVADYRSLYGRVELSLGRNAAPAITTGERLRAYRNGAADHALEELYFQFGRYLLISSSRPGQMPANLQGIWQNGIESPWHADYHNNINIQMNYWPALTTNLAECALPLATFIKTLEKPGRKTAASYFGSSGWTASISGNVFGFTAPMASSDMHWNLSFAAGPWLATHLWEYYDFTRDKDFLRDNYGLIKGSADFAADYLWKYKGFYTCVPATSPEHGPITVGATFVNAVAREILIDAEKASRILGRDTDSRSRWNERVNNIMPYRVGRYGQLMEWYDDIDDPSDEHRHVNHLFGLHPGNTINMKTTPELAEAARVTLEHRGDGATGWSMGWKLNFWARLHDGNHAYVLFGNLLKNGTLDNLWDSHPPFQIDGNFGGTAGVAEMLLQSYDDTVLLLPALPDAWDNGSVRGLCARGNFEVDIEWSAGRLLRAVVKSKSGGTCNLLYGNKSIKLDTKRNKKYEIGLDGGNLTLLR